MKVKYTGKLPEFIVDYNGKRYCFNKIRPITDIPYEIYNHIQQTGHMSSYNVIPVEESAGNEDVEVFKGKIKELMKEIEVLTTENLRLFTENNNLKMERQAMKEQSKPVMPEKKGKTKHA